MFFNLTNYLVVQVELRVRLFMALFKLYYGARQVAFLVELKLFIVQALEHLVLLLHLVLLIR